MTSRPELQGLSPEKLAESLVARLKTADKFGGTVRLDPDATAAFRELLQMLPALLAEVERLSGERDLLKVALNCYSDEQARLRTALSSIAKNSCCDNCQEAALVARHALEIEP